MKLKIYMPLLLLIVTSTFYAQIGIGTTSPNASSMLDITSANSGLLIPRVPLASVSDVTTIASPATSLLVYNSGFAPNGYYYFNGTIWVQLGLANSGWLLTGNSGTSSATNFLGTTDNVDIVFRRFNVRAGFIGNPNTSTGNKNTSFGANSLNPLGTGIRNTAIGSNVMPGNTTGQLNVSIGDQSMFSNLGGSTNTAIGVGALYSNTSGNSNVALGRNALTSSNANNNTALGFGTLRQNASGNYNVAIGNQAGYNETGSNKLYIEISTVTSPVAGSDSSVDNALIYGEFDNRIVRTNGTIQIGNPATTGFSLPIVRGTARNVLQTDGIGGTSWVAASTLSITETDPQVSSATTNVVPKWNGTTLVDGVMTDDGTNVGVGVTPAAGNKLEVNGKTKTTDFQMTNGAAANYVLQSDASGNASWALPNNMLSIVRAVRSTAADQALTNGGWQKLLFDATVFDTNSEFNTGSNRFVATRAGYYQINAGYHIKSTTSTNQFSIGVRINGGFYQETTGFHFGSGIVSRNINCIVNLTAGQYVEIFVENTLSGALIDGYSGKTFFEVKEIR